MAAGPGPDNGCAASVAAVVAKRRLPWGVRSLRRKHATEGGLIVYGWFNRLVGWPPRRGWEAVRVAADGSSEQFLDQKDRGPVFLPLRNGRHLVEFSGTEGRLFSTEITVRNNHVLIDFKPAQWWPFLRATEPRWRVTTLGPVASVDG